jgi:hypothetical protein
MTAAMSHQDHVAANQDHAVQSHAAHHVVSQDTMTMAAATKMQFACQCMFKQRVSTLCLSISLTSI